MAVHERVWEKGAPPSGSSLMPRPWRPEGTYALLGICAAVWLIELAEQALVDHAIAAVLAGAKTVPFGLAVLNGNVVRLDEWTFVLNTDFWIRPWALITSTVAHSFTDPTHLLFNGLFLFFFGPSVERLLGIRRFLVLFFVGGAVAGILQVELAAALGNGGGALGASGALMVLFGVLMAIMPTEKILVYGIIPVPFWIAGIGYAALDVLGTFNPASTVGNYAHLAGMALGLAYGVWQKRDWQRRGLRIVRS